MVRTRVLTAAAIVAFVGLGASWRLLGGQDASNQASAGTTVTTRAPASPPPTTRPPALYALGDRVESSGLRLVLDDVTDPFESTNPVVTPVASRRWVAADVTLTDLSPRPITIEGTEFSLLDANDLRFHLAETAEHLPAVDGVLQPGETRHATLVFEVPQGARDLRLSFDGVPNAAPVVVSLG